MSHTIKLEDPVYTALDDFRRKKETFSQAVSRLLDVQTEIEKIIEILEGQVQVRVNATERIQHVTNADAVRRDVEARTLTK